MLEVAPPPTTNPYVPWLLKTAERGKRSVEGGAELYERIRRDNRNEGQSVRAFAARHHVHRRTVRQALASATPPARKVPEREAPALGPWDTLIRAWLVADRSAPRKQRHTARRVHQRLRDEYGANVAESTVRAYVARVNLELDNTLRVVTVPQTHGRALRKPPRACGSLWSPHACRWPVTRRRSRRSSCSSRVAQRSGGRGSPRALSPRPSPCSNPRPLDPSSQAGLVERGTAGVATTSRQESAEGRLPRACPQKG